MRPEIGAPAARWKRSDLGTRKKKRGIKREEDLKIHHRDVLKHGIPFHGSVSAVCKHKRLRSAGQGYEISSRTLR